MMLVIVILANLTTKFLGKNWTAAGKPAVFLTEDNMSKIQDMRELVNLHASGLSDEEIAERIPYRNVDWVQEVRSFLELPQNFPVRSRRQAQKPVQFESMVSHYEASKKKSRKCLKCALLFESEGPQNRICRLCSKKQSFNLGQEWVGASL
jgi:hypothetical protein